MEWRFYWSNGKTVSRRTALVQIGDDRIILLVQLSAMTRKLNLIGARRSVAYLATGFPSELKVSFRTPSMPLNYSRWCLESDRVAGCCETWSEHTG